MVTCESKAVFIKAEAIHLQPYVWRYYTVIHSALMNLFYDCSNSILWAHHPNMNLWSEQMHSKTSPWLKISQKLNGTDDVWKWVHPSLCPHQVPVVVSQMWMWRGQTTSLWWPTWPPTTTTSPRWRVKWQEQREWQRYVPNVIDGIWI